MDMSTVGSGADSMMTYAVWAILIATGVGIALRFIAARQHIHEAVKKAAPPPPSPAADTAAAPGASPAPVTQVEVGGRALTDTVAAKFDFDLFKED